MKILWWGVAIILFVLGLATVWMPIPTGVPLMALGAIVVIATSRSAARMLRQRRRRGSRLNRVFVWLEDRAPLHFSRILKRTRPRKKID
ncbi:hypothetical protein [Roseibium sp. RKSG952]|uniref:hypothetical protein n=1 Tax=Roseibium sp. RKSG952 TaxID=2529384 RepID=UPI0012BBA966|nr:hypothetical protein [Roseibium sp. RKSG952]MTH98214.1 hypothetical protein [Roseibium sp. RKSG952]